MSKKECSELINKLYGLIDETYEIRKEYLKKWRNLMSEFDNINMMPEESYFSFVLETSPFDCWEDTMSADEVFKKHKYGDCEYTNRRAHLIKKEEALIEKFIHATTGEKPVKIAFTSIPTPTGGCFELVGLAKINSNGTSFVFTCDLLYLEYLTMIRGL